jgi:hypothetical protein
VKHGTPVMILDSNKNIMQEFDSQLKAKAFLGCSRASVSKYLNTGELFKSKSIGDVYIISNEAQYFVITIRSMLYIHIYIYLGNAVTFRRIYSILFNRVTIMILLTTGLMGCESLFVSCLDTGIGVYNGLFHSTAITHSFDQFVHIIGAIILFFFPFTEGSTDLTSILLSVIPAHAVTPIVVYSNADTQKFEIIKENKGKSGIYR